MARLRFSFVLLAIVLLTVAYFLMWDGIRHDSASQPKALTNEAWEVVSNGRLGCPSVRVEKLPFGKQIKETSDENLRRLLKLLMPFDATTEARGERFDYELIYQAGKDPVSIYVDLSRHEMRFWMNDRPTVYRSGSRDAFINGIDAIIN